MGQTKVIHCKRQYGLKQKVERIRQKDKDSQAHESHGDVSPLGALQRGITFGIITLK